MVWNISVVSLGYLLSCVHSQPTVYPLFTAGGEVGGNRERNREGLDAVQTLFSKS